MSDTDQTAPADEPLWTKILDEPYCDPGRRMDFVLLYDVTCGNPNGDPDAGNLPRMDPTTGRGIVTDVCIKRKIRDHLASLPECDIYIQSEKALNTRYFEAARTFRGEDAEEDEREAVGTLVAELNASDEEEFATMIAVSGSDEEADSDSAGDRDSGEEAEADKPANFRDWLTEAAAALDGLDFDAEEGELRYLGERSKSADFKTLLESDEAPSGDFKKEIAALSKLLAKAKPSGSKKQRKARELVKDRMCDLYDDIRLFGAVLTAGTNAGQIRGPMQLAFGRSTRPILQQDAAITRCAITKESDRDRKQTEFGRKAWLSYAAYRQHGYFNAPLAKLTGMGREDLARFWEAIARMFDTPSASKGEMAVQDVLVFVHPNARGTAPSHRLFNRVQVEGDSGPEPTPRLTFKESDEGGRDSRVEAVGIECCRPLKDLLGDL